MIRNQAGQTVRLEMVDLAGLPFAGAVTVYVQVDTAAQAIGSVGGGAMALAGNGSYIYLPSQAETNGASIEFVGIGAGAAPSSKTYETITLAQSTALTTISTPGSVTVNALLIAALQRLLSGGDLPSADDLNTALLRLNDLIDAWKIEGLTVYTISRVLWTLSSASSYTVGSTGTVIVDRPSNAAGLRFAVIDNSQATPFELPVDTYTEDQYQGIAIKTQTSTYPQGFYYNPTSPLGTLVPWPIPTSSTLQGVLYAGSPVGEVGLYDTLSLPQGYRRFYRDTLAVELAPDFDVQPSPGLVQSAMDSKAMVKRANVRMVELVSDAYGMGGGSRPTGIYDFYAGP